MTLSRRVMWSIALVAMCGLVTVAGSRVLTAQPEYVALKAECGPGSRPETGLQGQMTAAERFSGPRTYNCNLELVGKYAGEGASWGATAIDACAYLGRNDGPGLQPRGTAVVDATDPRSPKAAGYLDSVGTIEVNETIHAHPGRKLLAAVSPYYPGDGSQTRSDSDFDIYDVSDCRRPMLKGSLNLPGLRSHGGYFAPDGRTFYTTSYTGNIQPGDQNPSNLKWRESDAVFAIDVSDPSRPRELVRWPVPADVGSAHQISISPDGTRAYLSLSGRQVGTGLPAVSGVAVVDITDVQARKPSPQLRVIDRIVWNDGGGLQGTLEVQIKGQPYLLASSTGPGGGPRAAGARDVCAGATTTSFGYVAVLDLRDELNLKMVSRLILEVSLPSHCAKVRNDPVQAGSYGPAFCVVDDPADAKLVACGYTQAGLRVFDIREPSRPREIAYYKPPASTAPPKPGSFNARSPSSETPRQDTVTRAVHFQRDRGEIWLVSHDNGLQIVRFTDWMKITEKDLF